MTNNKNYNPNFIGSFLVEQELCKKVITFFNENSELHQQGLSGGKIDENKKKSTDLVIFPKNLDQTNFVTLHEYIEELNKCYKLYKKEWPYLNEPFEKLDVGPFNIQKYNEGGHFSKIHSERESLSSLHRLFAFMTYLNDDFEGGETYFLHYDLFIKPQTGKTLIWPAEWTHAHRGDIVKSGTKYIITGWLDIPIINI